VAWISIVVITFFESLAIPLLVTVTFGSDAARPIYRWVPEGPAAFAMLFAGWLYAAIIVLIGLATRKIKALLTAG
jgi:hypothetical protein